jgi:hypothetical protein
MTASEQELELVLSQHFSAMGIDSHMFGDVLEQADPTEKFLEHFGVKGMKWGRRTSNIPAGETRAAQKKPGRRVTAEGGRGVRAHEDAIRSATQRQIAKKSTVDALSTKELQELVNRMNLEQQYSKLAAGTVSPGRKFVNDLLINTAKQQATQVVNQQASSLIEKQMKKAGAK